MKRQSLYKSILGAAGFLVLVSFQNCSKIQASDMSATGLSKVSGGDPVVVATDSENQPLPVTVSSSDDVGKKDPAAAADDKKYDDPKKKYNDDKKCDHHSDDEEENEVAEVDSEELQEYCGYDVKSIHNLVDIAQFKDKDAKLDLIKGKTLIYSSDSNAKVLSLSISSAVGRTIICGVKVDRLEVKKGRLEVYHSEIKAIGQQSGVVIKDSYSQLPAIY